MSEVFHVLINAKTVCEIPESESFRNWKKNSYDRNAVCREIFNDAVSELGDYLKSEIEYIKEDAFCPDQFVLGIEDPEAIVREAENWNNRIFRMYGDAFDYFEEMRSTLNCQSLKETFEKLESFAGAQIYELYRYSLRKALCDLDGRILYGSYGIVMDIKNPEGYSGYEFSTKVSSEMLEHIKAHPEQYAIIEVYYK